MDVFRLAKPRHVPPGTTCNVDPAKNGAVNTTATLVAALNALLTPLVSRRGKKNVLEAAKPANFLLVAGCEKPRC